MKFILKYLPFAGIIAINTFANAGRFHLENLKPYVLVISMLVLFFCIIAFVMKVRSYFTYGVAGIVILGAIAVFFVPSIGQFYLENAISGLYFGLLVVAFFPPLLKMDPFTYEYSKKDYPEVVTQTNQFRKINIIINYLWASLFTICIVLSKVTYSDDNALQMIISNVAPILLLVLVGIPMNIKLPGYLMGTVRGEKLTFKSVKEMFEAMPYGLNKELAAGVDTVVQFRLSGREPIDGYLTIKDLKCTYTDGIHPNPKTTITADSKLWLGISNNEISGDEAFINKKYCVDGDFTILLKLGDLFAPTEEVEDKEPELVSEKVEFEYKTFEPKRIKKIVVFDGGPRTEKYSKTTFMVKHFCKGAQAEGAEIETIRLKTQKIKPCRGCYTCWTKTPGVCVIKDDMTELLLKHRAADLIVFASPLYIFNVTGIMKVFLDRLLPVMKPYMMIKDGETSHPHRYDEDQDQGFVVFSAAGFPEVEHNFDGMVGMFRCMHTHFEKSFLMAEFYMPAAEIIVQPVYEVRRNKIKTSCFEAGRQVVNEGKIDPEFMQAVSDPGLSRKKFQEQANMFWKSMDGKIAFYKNAPMLKYD